MHNETPHGTDAVSARVMSAGAGGQLGAAGEPDIVKAGTGVGKTLPERVTRAWGRGGGAHLLHPGPLTAIHD